MLKKSVDVGFSSSLLAMQREEGGLKKLEKQKSAGKSHWKKRRLDPSCCQCGGAASDNRELCAYCNGLVPCLKKKYGVCAGFRIDQRCCRCGDGRACVYCCNYYRHMFSPLHSDVAKKQPLQKPPKDGDFI